MSTEPQRHILTLAPGLEMAFRLIPLPPPEGFLMGERGVDSWDQGNEEPAHRVRLTRAFWMAETPVTQAQFAVWTRAAKVVHENGFKNKPECPAENLNWREAVAYCQWLSRSCADRFPADFGRAVLPTEAEWEWACRAGTTTDYWNGDGAAALAEVGWFSENSGGETHPVREKPANPFGLFDLHGNVWEWCHDVYRSEAYKTRVAGICDPGDAERESEIDAPPAESDARNRVFRGGSWRDTARFCRSAIRLGGGPGLRIRNLGFRVCLVPGPAVKKGQTAAAERRTGRASQAGDRSGAEGQEAGEARPGVGSGVPGRIARAAAKIFSQNDLLP